MIMAKITTMMALTNVIIIKLMMFISIVLHI